MLGAIGHDIHRILMIACPKLLSNQTKEEEETCVVSIGSCLEILSLEISTSPTISSKAFDTIKPFQIDSVFLVNLERENLAVCQEKINEHKKNKA